MLTKLNRKHADFTLVEIMIVVEIIALLAAIAVPGFLRARKRSQASKFLNDLRMIDAAVDQYGIETNKKSNDVVGTADWTNYVKKGGALFRRRLTAFCGKQWPRDFLLGAIGFIIRLLAIQGGLIWDDIILTRDNPFIKSPLLALETFRHYLFLDSLSGLYRPVQNLSYMFDYFFWNTDPAGFHLSNILLHVAAGLLLYRLLRHLFGKGAGLWNSNDPGMARAGALAAFIISGIWMVHPVHSAAIDYISGRADSL